MTVFRLLYIKIKPQINLWLDARTVVVEITIGLDCENLDSSPFEFVFANKRVSDKYGSTPVLGHEKSVASPFVLEFFVNSVEGS